MVAIRQHSETPGEATHLRRVRAFFRWYALLTLFVPFCLGLIGPFGLLACWGACQIVIIPESVLLLHYVQQGRDEAPECRWLGVLVLSRMFLLPVCWVLSMLMSRR
jgi:hypothetical protein